MALPYATSDRTFFEAKAIDSAEVYASNAYSVTHVRSPSIIRVGRRRPISTGSPLGRMGNTLASFTDAVTETNYSCTYTDGGRLRSAKVATGSTLNSLLCLSFNRNKNFTPGASFGNLE